MRTQNMAETPRRIWRNSPIEKLQPLPNPLPSPVWWYHAIFQWVGDIRLKKISFIEWPWLRMKHHFFYTGYPEDMKYPGRIPLVAILMGTVLIPLLGVALLFGAVMGGIRLLTRFYEISYWIRGIKVDRTRYSLVNNGGRIETTILPEDQAKLDKKQKRIERLQQLKEKRLSKRTLAKN